MSRAAKAHHHEVCPFWVGHLLANPIRNLFHNSLKILEPHVAPGMRVLDVGPGMGFFSLPMARLVGPSGRVICVDIQEKMLGALMRRARRAHLADRIETRACDAKSLGIADLAGGIDFVLAFAVVHEIGDATRFFNEIRVVLKPRGRALFAEPRGHVSERSFQESLSAAKGNGFREVAPLKIRGSQAAILERT
jgi:ubiquinone/menaquinone biosynthesis C-methylase UbiE